MHFLRLTLFHIIFYVSIVAVSLISGVLFFSPRALVRWIVHVWCAFVLFILRTIIGLRYELRGVEHIPDGPCIFASKHQSVWETFMLFHLMPKGVLVTKSDLFFIPFWGLGMWAVGFVAVHRETPIALRGLIKMCQKRVEQGYSIIIFPEGTRKAPGAALDYQIGVAALYKFLDVPCVPIAVNAGKFWPRRSFARNPGTIEIEIMPPLEGGLPRKVFMKRLEEIIETKMKELN